MKCPNCSNEVPETANVCGYCGNRLRSAAPQPKVPPLQRSSTGIPGWTWGCIGVVLIVGIAGLLIFFVSAPSLFAPVSNNQFNQPAETPKPIQVVVTATHPPPALIATNIPSTTQTNPDDRCDLFESSKIKFTYPSWKRDKPLVVAVYMSGGIPGLEKEISSERDEWVYTLTIGDENEHSTTDCRFEGYKEKMFCYIKISEKYANYFVPMHLKVNGCSSSIYEGWAEIPPIE
jgi:hypothetical protein